MKARNTGQTNTALSFGPFRLAPTRRILSDGSRAIALGSRAMDILLVLVENAGDLVTKEHLMARVWPTTNVVEDNVSVHIAALRRALGDGKSVGRYVMTIPGRGYRFVAPVTELGEDPPHRSMSGRRQGNVMLPMTKLIGREADIECVGRRLAAHRLVTITGPGGVGKSAVAFAAARQVDSFEAGVWRVDLSTAEAASEVRDMIHGAIRSAFVEDIDISPATGVLQGRNRLLLLDNCEHWVEIVAEVVHALLLREPTLQILATSRESLRIESEVLFRLSPLGVPLDANGAKDVDHLSYPAVQLFVERAHIDTASLVAGGTELRQISGICRMLGGLPLAIGLACDSIDGLGLDGLTAYLGKGLDILAEGKRTAPNRQKSLRASADWSFRQLPAPGRSALIRLAIFEGPFAMEEAIDLMAQGNRSSAERIHDIASLVTKSLLMFDLREGAYKMIPPTRMYALEALKQHEDFNEVASRRTRIVLERLNRMLRPWRDSPLAEWPEIEAGHCRDLQASIDWAFSGRRDLEVGILLTIAAVPFLLRVEPSECRSRLERAITELDRNDLSNPMARTKLRSAFVAWALQVRGLTSEAVLVWRRTIELADNLANQETIGALLEQAVGEHLRKTGQERDPYISSPLELGPPSISKILPSSA